MEDTKKSKIIIVFIILIILLIGIVFASVWYFKQNKTECGECQYLSEGVCLDYNCCDHSDCNDNNPNTDDICYYAKTESSFCTHKTISQTGSQVDKTSQPPSQPSENTCSDGTPYNECSEDTHKYCDPYDGKLYDDCTTCGCSEGFFCSFDNTCQIGRTCSDGTRYEQCSDTRPKRCEQGTLINKCSSCGCPAGFTCPIGNENCVEEIGGGDCLFTKSDLSSVGFDTSNMIQRIGYGNTEHYSYGGCIIEIEEIVKIDDIGGEASTEVYDEMVGNYQNLGIMVTLNTNEYGDRSIRMGLPGGDSRFLFIQKGNNFLQFSYNVPNESKINGLVQIWLGRI